jgi:hypothetical protein
LFGNLFGYFSKHWAIFSRSSGHPGLNVSLYHCVLVMDKLFAGDKHASLSLLSVNYGKKCFIISTPMTIFAASLQTFDENTSMTTLMSHELSFVAIS